jgi:hypothetical protein
MNFPKKVTHKLFYRKWIYKIDCRCSGSWRIKRLGIWNAVKYCNQDGRDRADSWSGSPTDKVQLLAFTNAVESYLDREDVQTRTESNKFTLFCNDKSVYASMLVALEPWISEITEPANDTELEYITDNGAKKVICNNIPYGLYEYKVYLRANTDVVTREAFNEWAKKYNDKINVSKSVMKWLNGGNYYYSNPYIHVADSPMLSMVYLFLGDNVQRAEHFITRSCINTLTKQEELCQA